MNVDVHNSPSKACVFNSQETGEREVVPCPLTGKSSSAATTEEFCKAAESAAFYLSTSSATSSQLPLKSSYLSPDQHSSSASAVHFDSQSHHFGYHSDTSAREARATERQVSGESEKPQREESPSVAERKVLLEAATVDRNSSPHQFVSSVPIMAEGKANGAVANGGSGSQLSARSSSGGSAKSVIKISSNNVTIISTGKNGSASPKVTTTPLRANQDYALSGAHVTTRRQDTEFISALTQKFQPNGAPGNFVRPAPVASSASYRGSNSQSKSSGGKDGAKSTTPSGQQGQTPVMTSVASPAVTSASSSAAMSVAASVAQKRQQIADSIPPPPPAMMNGCAEVSSSAETNGLNGNSSLGVAPPPPPAPPAPSRSNGDQPTVQRADASYTPR